jgi:hypothetical protein
MVTLNCKRTSSYKKYFTDTIKVHKNYIFEIVFLVGFGAV